MSKVISVLLITFVCLTLSAQLSDEENYRLYSFEDSLQIDLETELPQAVDYYYELIKFYISEAQFDLALAYLDSISSNMTDSLYFFEGLSYAGKQDWRKAAVSFENCIISHRREEMLESATSEFKNVLAKLPPQAAIDKISKIINRLPSNEFLAHFLFIMAWLYEENQLFEEANDVYQTIIRETDHEDKINTALKIVVNDIFLKQYRKAKSVLQPILALNDSIYNQDALFFNYIANYSLQDYTAARSDLLRLYNEYPLHPQREEILQGLADVFEKEAQLLLSWYFLNELHKIGPEAKRFLIQKEINRIKKRIGSENLNTDQFQYLLPRFEQ